MLLAICIDSYVGDLPVVILKAVSSMHEHTIRVKVQLHLVGSRDTDIRVLEGTLAKTFNTFYLS